MKHTTSDFLSHFSAPARRALESIGINTLSQVIQLNDKELLKLHGFGKSSIKKIKILVAKEQQNNR